MRKVIQIVILLLWTPMLFAQDVRVSGKVTDSNGDPVPGASIIEKGTTNGTISDTDGNYSLSAPAQSTLMASFIGMKRVETTINGKSNINFTLVEDLVQMDDVVVTALGIKKEKKALGYATQEVGSEELLESADPNVTDALQGRVAGLQINSGGGSAGSSSTIILRGVASINGSNQPLIVVDGVPIDNSGGLGTFSARSDDVSNGLSDINPNDIESMSVLKGPAATALYGIDAANGAILITTKKGESGRGKITYSNNFSIATIRDYPTQQRIYGQGNRGEYTGSDGLSQWGPKYPAGATLYNNNTEDYFKSSFSKQHNLTFEGGTEKATFRLSAGRVEEDGIQPNNDYKRDNFKLSGTSKILDNLSVTSSLNFTRSGSVKPSKGQGSALLSTLLWPADNDMSIYGDPFATQESVLPSEGSGLLVVDNPYYLAENNYGRDKTNRTIGNFSMSYDPFSWWNIRAVGGFDYYSREYTRVQDPLTSTAFVDNGNLYVANTDLLQWQTQLFSTFTKDVTEDLKVNFLAGTIAEDKHVSTTGASGSDFQLSDRVSLNNTTPESEQASQSSTRRRVVSVIGKLDVEYMNMLYLTFAARNDWSSTLPKENRSFFYPSVSASWLASELFSSKDVVSYAQLRMSYAKAGNDAPPYKTRSTFVSQNSSGGGYALGVTGGNANLEPERTTSYEIGTALKFFDNRFGIDANFYVQESKNQILDPRLSYVTGHILTYVNGGSVLNRGVELQFNSTPIRNENFQWDLNVNFATNDGTVTELPASLDEFYLSDTWVYNNVRGAYVEDLSTGTLTGFDYNRTPEGEVIIGDDGFPSVDRTDFVPVGDRTPDLTGGIINNFRYKNWNLSFLIDYRVGGDVYNATELFKYVTGVSDQTLIRGHKAILDGVVETVDASGNTIYVENTTPVVLDQDYFTNGSIVAPSQFVEKNINWFRMKNINISYTLPQEWFGKLPFQSARIYGTIDNLFLITNYTGLDPDVNALNSSAGGLGGQGIDYGNTPNPRVYSLGLSVTL